MFFGTSTSRKLNGYNSYNYGRGQSRDYPKLCQSSKNFISNRNKQLEATFLKKRPKSEEMTKTSYKNWSHALIQVSK